MGRWRRRGVARSVLCFERGSGGEGVSEYLKFLNAIQSLQKVFRESPVRVEPLGGGQ